MSGWEAYSWGVSRIISNDKQISTRCHRLAMLRQNRKRCERLLASAVIRMTVERPQGQGRHRACPWVKSRIHEKEVYALCKAHQYSAHNISMVLKYRHGCTDQYAKAQLSPHLKHRSSVWAKVVNGSLPRFPVARLPLVRISLPDLVGISHQPLPISSRQTKLLELVMSRLE